MTDDLQKKVERDEAVNTLIINPFNPFHPCSKKEKAMKRDKIYISGPVSSIGIEEARRRFGEAEKHLQRLGYRTSNPTKMRLPVFLAQHGHYRLCLILQLAWLCMTCQCIYLLDGWHTSDGARAERAISRIFGLTALYEQRMEKKSKKHKKD